jgi:Methyltransferase domain
MGLITRTGAVVMSTMDSVKEKVKWVLPDPVVHKVQGTLIRIRRIQKAVHDKAFPDYRMEYPPGHFYSLIPSLTDIRARASKIFATPSSLPGIDLREEQQLDLVSRLASYYPDQPFESEPVLGLRYFFDNNSFSYGDALVLYSMIRELRPSRIIEVGSGFSSAAMIDTSERFMGYPIHFTFIEPFSSLIDELCGEFGDSVEVIREQVQEVSPSVFETLEAGDVLFIDSTHVAKPGSDVNYLFFEVLPVIRPGVIVHFHDIFYPFEYPRHWIEMGRTWNEAYLLRALLLWSGQFEVLLWNSYLATHHRKTVVDKMPLWGRNPGGSIWLKRL